MSIVYLFFALLFFGSGLFEFIPLIDANILAFLCLALSKLYDE